MLARLVENTGRLARTANISAVTSEALPQAMGWASSSKYLMLGEACIRHGDITLLRGAFAPLARISITLHAQMRYGHRATLKSALVGTCLKKLETITVLSEPRV